LRRINRKYSFFKSTGLKWYLITGLITVMALTVFFLIVNQISHEPPPSPSLNKNISHNQNVYIIFLNGLGCHYNGNLSEALGFPSIRRSLARAGYSFFDDRFLLFSYRGGQVIEGIWRPQKYSAKDTGQPISLSVSRLAHLIDNFSLAHPEAKFILVGHSLGGRIALDYVCTTSLENRQKIKGVITLNSPLLGVETKVPDVITHLLGYSNSLLASPAVKQLLREFNYRQEMVRMRRETIRELQDQGLQVATFATQQDLVVKPFTGCLMDERGKPVTHGFIVNVKVKKISLREIFGHMGILEHQAVLRYITSLCLK